MIFSATFDFFHSGVRNFGIIQFSGFVVSTIVALAGLRKITFPKKRLFDGLLILVYIAGILFMGLKPGSPIGYQHVGILRDTKISLFDFTINIIGFIPLSYLMMSYLLAGIRIYKKVSVTALVMVSGLSISLIMELLQYFLPNRISSIIDLFANGIGTCFGISYYLLERRFSRYISM